MGPTIIFDKSAFQRLNTDETVWLDALYQCNITPLFFVETLADLSLDPTRKPEHVVRSLARNTPQMSPVVNAHHKVMCLANLHGEEITMDGRPAVAGLVAANTRSGKLGLSMTVSPEQRAFQRWTRGAFREVERDSARAWRSELLRIDLNAVHTRYRPLVLGANPRPKDLHGIKQLAEKLRADPRPLYVPDALWLAFSLIGVPVSDVAPISARWRAMGRPPLVDFAPYAAHVILVDLVFNLAIGAELVGRARPTNKIDLGYLYYLPFTMVFLSCDKVQVRLAPLVMRPDQTFVHGDDLKADMRRLDEHYSALPDPEKECGVYSFASRPPTSREFLTTRLWDQHLPAWRDIADREARAPLRDNEERDRSVVDELTSIEPLERPQRQRVRLTDENATFLKIERVIPVRKGKWRLLPPGVEKETGRGSQGT